MKVFVTKYALTKGILEIEGRVSESFPTMFIASRTQTFHGKDWHRMHTSALIRADQMRMAKIESLKQSIVKLQKMSFII